MGNTNSIKFRGDKFPSSSVEKRKRKKDIGKAIENHRLKLGMSIGELSRCLRINPDLLESLENGTSTSPVFRYTKILKKVLIESRKRVLGETIYRRRMALRMTTDELAEVLNVKKGILESMEKGICRSPLSYYKRINELLIIGDFNKVKVNSDLQSECVVHRPKGFESQHTRKPWTNVLVKMK